MHERCRPWPQWEDPIGRCAALRFRSQGSEDRGQGGTRMAGPLSAESWILSAEPAAPGAPADPLPPELWRGSRAAWPPSGPKAPDRRPLTVDRRPKLRSYMEGGPVTRPFLSGGALRDAPLGSLPWGRCAPASMFSIRHPCRMFDAGTGGRRRRTNAGRATRAWHVACRGPRCRPDSACGHAPPSRAHTKGGDTWPTFVRPPHMPGPGHDPKLPVSCRVQGGGRIRAGGKGRGPREGPGRASSRSKRPMRPAA